MKIDVMRSLNQLNISNKNDILSRLNVGDAIRVQVVEASAETLTLRLPDGSLINASSLLQLNISIGDFLDLSVNHKTDSQIFVEIVKEAGTNSVKSAEIKNMLLALNIPVNDQNMEIAQEMIRNNVALTKENFQWISKLLNQYKQMTPEKALFMVGNEIPVDEKNMMLLDQFVQHKQQIGDQLKTLMAQLNKLAEGAGRPQDPSSTNVPNNADHTGQLQRVPNNEETYIPRQPGVQTSETTEAGRQNVLMQRDTGARGQMPAEGKIESSNADQKPVIPSDTGNGSVQGKEAAIREMSQKLANVQNMTDHLIQGKGTNVLEPGQLDTVLSREAAAQEAKDLGALIKTLFKVVDASGADRLPQDIQAEKTIKDIAEIVGRIRTEIEPLNIAEKQNILSTINHIEESLKFIEHLNRDTTFVQIPLHINGQDTTAELYVFKDARKKKKVDPSDATVLLSLFTINLGQVEAMIHIVNKNVECLFRLEDKRILEFIRKNSTPLYSLLDAQGYNLTKVSYKHITRQQQANIVNVQKIKEGLNRKYSFDMRV